MAGGHSQFVLHQDSGCKNFVRHGKHATNVSPHQHRVNCRLPRVLRCCKRFGPSGKPLPYGLGVVLLGIAQRIAERRHARVRSELMRIDDQVSDMLAFTGRAE